MKHINVVLYVIVAKHNLLGVHYLIENGYPIGFNNNEYIIYDQENDNQVTHKINMATNKIFSFNFPCEANRVLKVGYANDFFITDSME